MPPSRFSRLRTALRAGGEIPPAKPVAREIRQLVTPRDDLRPLYLNLQGLRVGKSGEVLQVREKDELKQKVRIGEICQVNLMGNVQVSTQAVQALCDADKPVCYFSQGGCLRHHHRPELEEHLSEEGAVPAGKAVCSLQ